VAINHSLLGGQAGVQKDELELNLKGCSNDPKTASALSFVLEIVEKRGDIDNSSIAKLTEAGFSDEEVVEIIWPVGLNMFTNYSLGARPILQVAGSAKILTAGQASGDCGV
jgi:hypothetical protein